MKFTTAFFGLMFTAAATTTIVSADPVIEELCGDYTTNPIIIEDVCDSTSVEEAIIQRFESTKAGDCPHNVDAELELIAGTPRARIFRNAINDKCNQARQAAIDAIPSSNWDGLTIIPNGEDIVLDDFFEGKGYLNSKFSFRKNKYDGWLSLLIPCTHLKRLRCSFLS